MGFSATALALVLAVLFVVPLAAVDLKREPERVVYIGRDGVVISAPVVRAPVVAVAAPVVEPSRVAVPVPAAIAEAPVVTVPAAFTVLT